MSLETVAFANTSSSTRICVYLDRKGVDLPVS